MSKFWSKTRRFLILKVLHTDDTPHAIALGAAIAMLVAFTPLVGLQTVIAIGLAALFRANKAICVPTLWITNPFTIVPIYGACLGLGRIVTGSPIVGEGAGFHFELEHQQALAFYELEFWKRSLSQLAGLGAELWIGCVLIGTVAGVVTYFAARWGVTSYRERRRGRILRRELVRSTLHQGTVKRRTEPV